MAVNFAAFNSPEFQQRWGYRDPNTAPTAQSLGLDDETFNYFKATNYNPWQPNAGTNIQGNLFGATSGGLMNTMVNPGQTPKDFQPVTSTPIAAPTSSTYSDSINKNFTQPQQAPQNPMTSSTGSQPAPAPQPTNPWTAQPKPVSEVMEQNATAPTSGRGSTFGAITGQTQVNTNPMITSQPMVPDMPMAPSRAATNAIQSAQTDQGTAAVASRGAQLPAVQSFVPPAPTAGGGNIGTMGNPLETTPTGGEFQNPMLNPGNYPGGRGNYMGYGANGGGMRVDPNYLPENWNYEDSPEFKFQLEQALRGANRRALALGRSDSTGTARDLNNLEMNLRAAEVNQAHRRAVEANTANYNRMFGANQVNYGRTRDEDQTGWDRAAYLDNVAFRNQGRDFNQNYSLADLGFRATQSGVNAGNQAGQNLAILLGQNGANQASLALARGDVSSDMIQRLLNSGWTFAAIEQVFGGGGNVQSTMPVGPGAPQLPPFDAAGIGDPGAGALYSGVPGTDWWSA